MKQIPLTQGKYAVVDDFDAERIAKYGWRTSSAGYALTTTGGRLNRKTVYMHRLLTNANKGQQVDHINGDKLDNRRCNLRLCTEAENKRNTGKKPPRGVGRASKFKGVTPIQNSKKWRARITVNYKKISLGRFDNEQEAASAYDAAAVLHFGQFANLNFKRSA